MAKGIAKKKVPDAPWENKKIPKPPFESQAYGLVQIAKAISGSMEGNTTVIEKLLNFLKSEDRKIEINIPEIKIPQAPSMKMPDIKIPEPQVHVTAPEQKMPNIEVKAPDTTILNEWETIEFDFQRHPNLLLKKIIATKVK